MWYFSWILGVTMAVLLAIINALAWEAKECLEREGKDESTLQKPGPGNARRG